MKLPPQERPVCGKVKFAGVVISHAVFSPAQLGAEESLKLEGREKVEGKFSC